MYILFLLFVLLDVFNNSATLKNIRWLLVMCVMILVVGSFFKILHWKGANILLLTGHIFIVATYILQIILRNFKPAEEIIKTIFICSLSAASLFQILHWPYAFELILAALAFFLMYFSMLAYKFFLQRNQKSISPPGNENNL